MAIPQTSNNNASEGLLFGGNSGAVHGLAFSNDSDLHAMLSAAASPTLGQAKGTGTKEEDQVMFKTQLCRGYQAKGRCPYEYMCMFAHGPAEMRTKQMNLRDGLTSLPTVRQYQWQLKAAGYSTKKLGHHSNNMFPQGSDGVNVMAAPFDVPVTFNQMRPAPIVTDLPVSMADLPAGSPMHAGGGFSALQSAYGSPTVENYGANDASWAHNPYGAQSSRSASGPCQCAECVAVQYQRMQAANACRCGDPNCTYMADHNAGGIHKTVSDVSAAPTMGMRSVDSVEPMEPSMHRDADHSYYPQ